MLEQFTPQIIKLIEKNREFQRRFPMPRPALILTFCSAILMPAAAFPELQSETVPAPAGPELAPDPQRVVANLQEKIRELETELGPYDAELGEQLLSLGLANQTAREYDQAAEVLDRALHIRRVNSGLHDLGQVPILEELIKSNIGGENWDALDQNYQLLLWVYRRNYQESDPRFLPVVDRMGRWKLQAYKDNLLKQSGATTIQEAESLFDDTADLLEDQVGETDPRLIDPLYGKALASYQIMKEEMNKPLSGFRGSSSFSRVTYRQQCFTVAVPVGNRVVTQVRCTVIPVTDVGGYLDDQRLKDLSVEQRLFSAKRALKQVVSIHEAHPELGAESFARALIHLGDWHMLAEQRGTALQQYKRAYEIMQQSGAGEQDIGKLLGSPASVPSLRLSVAEVDEQLAAGKGAEVVKVTFDVSSSGRARNVQIIDDGGTENVLAKRRAREMVKDSKYRPRFENGEPVDTIGVQVSIPMRQLVSSSSDA